MLNFGLYLVYSHHTQAMAYFNPITLLPDAPSDAESLKNTDLKKLRKKLLAELSLSDDEMLEVGGNSLSKDDILKGLEDLANEEKAPHLLFLYQHQDLSDFLNEGKPGFLQNYEEDPAFKEPAFLTYVGQSFAERYNTHMGQLYDGQQIAELNAIKDVPLLADSQHESRAYHRVASRLEESRVKLTEIKALLDKQVNAKGPYRDNVIKGRINEAFSLELVNALPDYFQKQRNTLAESLRAIAIQINNDFGKALAAAEILDLAVGLETDGLIREKLKKDSETIKQNVEDEKLSSKCFFCGQRDKEDASVRRVPMHKVGNVEHGFNSRRIQYKTIDLPVNRCRDCKKAHGNADLILWGLMVAGFFIGIGLAYLFGRTTYESSYGDVYTYGPDLGSYLVGAIVGLIVGWGAAYVWIDAYYAKQGTKSKSFSYLKKNHPLVIKFKSEGFVKGSKPS